MSALISLASKYTSANPFPADDFSRPDVRWAVLWAKYLSAKSIVDQFDKTGYSGSNALAATKKLTSFAEDRASSWIPEPVSRLVSTAVSTPLTNVDLRDLVLNQFFAAAEAMRLHEVDRASKLIANGVITNPEMLSDFTARYRVFAAIEDLNKKGAFKSIKKGFDPVPMGDPFTLGIGGVIVAVIVALIVVAGLVACVVMLHEIDKKNQFAREQCNKNPNSLACVKAVEQLSATSKNITDFAKDIGKYVALGAALYIGANLLMAKAQGAAIRKAIGR